MNKQGILLLFLAVISVCVAQQNYPAGFNLTIPNLLPEGIEYNSFATTPSIIFGSGFQGTIRSISPAGVINTFVNDSRLVGTFGLEATRGLLYIAVCNISGVSAFGGSYTNGTVQSALAIANATTGAVQQFYDLTSFGNPPPFANDVTVSPDGTVYVTDTVGGQVLRVIPATQSASVYSADPRFRANLTIGNGLSVNGIKYLAGFIFTCAPGNGVLFRITPSSASAPTVNQVGSINLPGCDGIRVTARDTLIVANGTLIQEVATNDGWNNAYILQSRPTIGGQVSTTCLVPEGSDQVVYATSTTGPIERSFSVPSSLSPSAVISTFSSSPSASASSSGKINSFLSYFKL